MRAARKTNQEDFTESATAWFVMLEKARAVGDTELEVKAQNELERLGVRVQFTRRKSKIAGGGAMSSAPTIERSLTPPQFGRRYGLNASKVLQLIARGDLRAVNCALDPQGERPRWKIPPEAVADFEAGRSSTPLPKITKRRRRRDRSVKQRW